MAMRVALFDRLRGSRPEPPPEPRPGRKTAAKRTASPAEAKTAAGAKARAGAKSGAKASPKAGAKATAKAAPAPGSRLRRKPAVAAGAEAASPRRVNVRPWRKAGPAEPAPPPEPAAEPKPRLWRRPAGRTHERERARERVRKPPPPLLQRRSVLPMLARAAVLAVAIVCMAAFAVALAKVTLVPSPSSDALIHTNLKPGASIHAYLDQPNVRDSVKQIGGNVLLGVPFGVLLPMLFPGARGLLRVVVLTALVMVMIEITQGAMVEGRAFDIDDVILNTAGSLLGYLLLGRRLGSALHPHRTHWWHRYFPPAADRDRTRP
ncbi:VanZ family protein [Actinacidiphila epipremni]